MKSERLILLLVIISILFAYINSKKSEHLEATTTISNEAIQSISSIYSNTGGTVSFNNFKATGKVDIPKWNGIIVMWSGEANAVPVGWALCDGTNNTPDLRGRFVLGYGKGDGLTERKKGEKGGLESVALTITEMPSHKHKFGVGGDNSGDRQATDGEGAGGTTEGWSTSLDRAAFKNWTTFEGGDKSITTVTGYNADRQSTWGTKPHENMPPYYVLAYIMKVS